MRPGFSLPDFNASLDVDMHRKAIPADATTKGSFFAQVNDPLKKAGHKPVGRDGHIGFKDYPLLEFVDAAVHSAKTLYPDTPLREGLRRLGRAGYQTLTSTLAGRVLFGVLGRDIVAITKLVSKAYEMTGKPQRATLVELGTSHSVIRLEHIYQFVDCYQIGVFEGVLAACNRTGTIQVRMLSPFDAELFTEWT